MAIDLAILLGALTPQFKAEGWPSLGEVIFYAAVDVDAPTSHASDIHQEGGFP